MAIFSRLLLSATALLLLSSSALAQNFNRTASNVQAPTQAAIDRLNTIDHFIVLMLENESFDQLFPNFPGAENLLDWMLGRSRNGIPYFPQVDLKGNTLSTLPVPQCSGVPCGNFPAAGLANAPYLATQYWPENATSSFDVTHRYYQEQWQINGGAMNQYVQWGAQATVNGAIQATGSGWAMQFWNVTAQYMGQLGMNFTVFDSFFVSTQQHTLCHAYAQVQRHSVRYDHLLTSCYFLCSCPLSSTRTSAALPRVPSLCSLATCQRITALTPAAPSTSSPPSTAAHRHRMARTSLWMVSSMPTAV